MDSEKYIITAEEIEKLEGLKKTHFLNPNGARTDKSLGDLVGLKNIAFHLSKVEPRTESAVFHRHIYEEECVYIISGQATVVIGENQYSVKAGDFIGYPADGKAHTMINDGDEELICIVVGHRSSKDVVEYPKQGKILYKHHGNWDLVDTNSINPIKPYSK
jgi:uncharacterized cupin superfamily protein